ncbi:DNA recombination protein RmuC [bacterium]|jgi:DNA recombination protein RmuC|nr:DNA recombination protein RmuC [bacterium]MBT4335274.1 DNA recombination protein RmuC [bacterium]MBT4495136.1 DNA recombination protein RmuC [bacterium]MBT4764376.1 DNA recombination protein RmuC [bacterium]MBT5401747.1 DNA recombination protein RmuC [bacterium]
MDIFSIILLIVVVIGFATIFWFLNKKGSNKDDQSLVMLQNQISEISRSLDQKLGDSNKMMQGQLSESTKIVRDVTEKLTKLDETNKQVLNFSDQLKNLQDILKNPKQRGVLGEYFLEETLKNVLPPNAYQMQYKFKNGDIVDAVVFVKDKIIPVDSKFSLENYERILNENNKEERLKLEKQFKLDLKNRIDETSKYVRPGEKTMDFAFMFIPSEAIYYDLLVNKVGAVKVTTRDLIEYAFKDKHVIIVSPTSFLAYLQTVLQGLRALQIEESAKEIMERVEKLSKHIVNYDEFLRKLGGHLGTTVNTYNTAYKEFKKIDKDVVKITGAESKIEPEIIDKPKNE